MSDVLYYISHDQDQPAKNAHILHQVNIFLGTCLSQITMIIHTFQYGMKHSIPRHGFTKFSVDVSIAFWIWTFNIISFTTSD